MVVFSEQRSEGAAATLRGLRGHLAERLRQDPALFVPRFERYAEAVVARTGYSVERSRAELNAGLERLLEPLVVAGIMTQKSADATFAELERDTAETRTPSELVARYRAPIQELGRSIASTSRGRQERGTRLAAQIMEERYGEKLSVRDLARVVGFAPDYFSKLFKRDEGVAPEVYLQRVRIERAKHLLRLTDLGVDQVAKLCGFSSRHYFHRLFKRAVQATPDQFRRKDRAFRRKGGRIEANAGAFPSRGDERFEPTD
jgi:AraC-like DNA-binding protein